MLKVGITGGIGSGKSTLSQLFGELGIPCYDSDAKAKVLMSRDEDLKKSIIETFGEESYVSGMLNREYIAGIVFDQKEKLAKLNSIVHPAVKEDFLKWADAQNAPYVILESAILFEAIFNDILDHVVCVLSPKSMRVERVISRDGLTAEQVEARMNNQLSDNEMSEKSDLCVVNFEIEDLEDAAKVFDKRFRYEEEHK